jgi:hypothetical protein
VKYKVPYKQRLSLALLLKNEIRKLDLIDTYDMIESIRIEAEFDRLGVLQLYIVSMYYFRYLDSNSDQFPSSVGSRKTPGFDMTENWMNNPKFKAKIVEIYEDFVKFMVKEYPILDFSKMLANPKVKIDVIDIY